MTTKLNGLELETQGKGNSLITKEQKIKKALLSGIILTTYKANLIGRTVNGQKFISNLRRQLPIKDTWQQAETGEHYKVYWIDPEFLKKESYGL